jgi:hypothetical protein
MRFARRRCKPFSGITGRGVMIEVAAASFSPCRSQRARAALDPRVAAHIADPLRFTATRELTPVPILGVPGWWSGNESETYYDDAAYFRPARAGSSR